MKDKNVVFILLTFIVLTVGINTLFLIDNINEKIEQSEKHQKRFENLILDSVKTHKWLENIRIDIKEHEPINVKIK